MPFRWFFCNCHDFSYFPLLNTYFQQWGSTCNWLSFKECWNITHHFRIKTSNIFLILKYIHFFKCVAFVPLRKLRTDQLRNQHSYNFFYLLCQNTVFSISFMKSNRKNTFYNLEYSLKSYIYWIIGLSTCLFSAFVVFPCLTNSGRGPWCALKYEKMWHLSLLKINTS